MGSGWVSVELLRQLGVLGAYQLIWRQEPTRPTLCGGEIRMRELQSLLINLSNNAKQHFQLHKKFRCFVEILESQVNLPDFGIKGINVQSTSDSDCFTATFLGRTFRFDFESVLVHKSTLHGKVTCHLVTHFPVVKAVFINDFFFDAYGLADVAHPDLEFDGDQLVVDDDLGGLYLFMRSLAMGLQTASKPTINE